MPLRHLNCGLVSLLERGQKVQKEKTVEKHLAAMENNCNLLSYKICMCVTCVQVAKVEKRQGRRTTDRGRQVKLDRCHGRVDNSAWGRMKANSMQVASWQIKLLQQCKKLLYTIFKYFLIFWYVSSFKENCMRSQIASKYLSLNEGYAWVYFGHQYQI